MACACSTATFATCLKREVRVDFYHLTRDPAEAVLPALAENTLKAGKRLLIVSGDPEQRQRISRALWVHKPESFLAHGEADEGFAERQPILLADDLAAANGACFVALADGVWREGVIGFERAFYLFDETRIGPARDCWRRLRGGDDERHYWKQEGGRWTEGA